MDDTRVGVIGAGGRGWIGQLAHKPGKGSVVVACCDVDDEILAEQPKHYGENILLTKNVGELLAADIDAVFICTPDWLHEEQAIAALESGKAVYLEKPLAITIEGADRILSTVARVGGKLYVGHNMRHMQFVLKMKSLIDEGRIGTVKTAWCRHFVGHGGDFYLKDWHSERRYSTGLLLQKGAHDIDVLHFLSGGRTARVNAMGGLVVYGDVVSNRQTEPPNLSKASRAVQKASLDNWPPGEQKNLSQTIDVEDVSMMQMLCDNGVLLSYQQCHFTPDYWRNYTIIGDKGRIENIGNYGKDAVIKLWNRRSSNFNEQADETFTLDFAEGSHGGSDARIIDTFLQWVRDGSASTPVEGASPLDARASVAAGFAATQSLRNNGHPVDIPPLPAEVAAYFS